MSPVMPRSPAPSTAAASSVRQQVLRPISRLSSRGSWASTGASSPMAAPESASEDRPHPAMLRLDKSGVRGKARARALMPTGLRLHPSSVRVASSGRCASVSLTLSKASPARPTPERSR
eukprot:Amastigsp_a513183_18.p4 type:complete len:119 gc:universal Amastigsp_a513183_18:1167-811(-)